MISQYIFSATVCLVFAVISSFAQQKAVAVRDKNMVSSFSIYKYTSRFSRLFQARYITSPSKDADRNSKYFGPASDNSITSNYRIKGVRQRGA